MFVEDTFILKKWYFLTVSEKTARVGEG